MEKRKRGRPRKNPEIAQPVANPFINDALDKLALARDYALTIESGTEDKRDFAELAGEARKAICEAGMQLENGLHNLGLLAGAGWFVPDLKRVA